MAAFLGGILAQEVVKTTGKYHPLHQSLYLDMFELLPDSFDVNDTSGEYSGGGSRYDDYVQIFGKTFQTHLAKLKVFVVGAGALGCEYVKSLAMIGAATDSEGLLTITDMDRIETSNLNRQFLFRATHVGKQKSTTAGEAAKDMNPKINVKAMEGRVGPDTEEVFDDAFWLSKDVFVNALDNVQARLYVDSRAVWYKRPLLESGTLGTKANMQVVLPFLTQSYGDTHDPPEESIPLCTLKHFPNQIEHTIEWSRDSFQGYFVDGPQEMISFLNDPPAALTKLTQEGSATTQREKLQELSRLQKRLTTDPSSAYGLCVEAAVHRYQESFHDNIAQLLHTFPEDHLTSEGNRFWSGPKRAPAPLRFDSNDATSVAFVQACANIYANNLGLPACKDSAKVAELAGKVEIAPFVPKSMKIKVDDKDTTQEGAEEDGAAVERLVGQLRALAPSPELAGKLQPAEFEKDDDSNYHIDFMWASANLRARNYKIKEADRQKAKMIAGKIIPAIATTTAMVTGLVTCELLKIVLHKAGLKAKLVVEDFRDGFVNLALPLFLLSEPLPPLKTVSKDYDPIAMGPVKAKPEGFTPWDIVETNGVSTLQELVDHIMKEYECEVVIISAGNACLYNSFLPAHKKRLARDVKGLYEEITKNPLPSKRTYLTIEVSCTDVEDGVDVQLPTVKLNF
jgi:ubiquitin-activating enzyme E1